MVALGTAEKLGFGYEAISRRRPGIVYAHINCFGHSGPFATRHGWEPSAQATTGLEAEFGRPEGRPSFMPLALSDYSTAYCAALGVLAALRERDSSGRGRKVETSLVAGVGLVQSMLLFDFPERKPMSYDPLESWLTSRLFRCADGWTYVHCPTENWPARISGNPRPMFREVGSAANKQVRHNIEKEFATKTCESLIAEFRQAGIAAERVRRLWELFDDEEVRASGLIRTTSDPQFGTVEHVGAAYYASWTKSDEARYIPLPGQHSRQILKEAGYTRAEIARLVRSGVVMDGSA